MNQFLLTIAMSLITGATAIIAPMAPKILERKTSINDRRGEELQKLANDLHGKTNSLWETSFELLQACRQEYDYDQHVKGNGLPSEEEWAMFAADQVTSYESAIDSSEAKMKALNQDISNILFRISTEFPQLSSKAAQLVRASQPCEVHVDLGSGAALEDLISQFAWDTGTDGFGGEFKQQRDKAGELFETSVAKQMNKLR